MKKPKKSETRISRKGRTHQGVYDRFLKKLISAREEAGLTSREVSVRMGRAHSFLSKCETGERSIEVFELIELAQIYDKPPQYFLASD